MARAKAKAKRLLSPPIKTIAVMIVIVKEVTVKTMIADIVVMIRVNPLGIERKKMREPSMKIILTMMWIIMMKT